MPGLTDRAGEPRRAVAAEGADLQHAPSTDQPAPEREQRPVAGRDLDRSQARGGGPLPDALEDGVLADHRLREEPLDVPPARVLGHA